MKVMRVGLAGSLVTGTILVVLSSLPYLSFDGRHPFLSERPALSFDIVWRTSLAVHVGAGMFCLVAGLLLLAGPTRAALHRWLGRLYVAVALGFMVPTGLHLSLYSKAGFLSGSAFALSAVAMGVFLVFSVRAIVRGNEARHWDFATRAYAQVASALTFRVAHLVFQWIELPYMTNYVLSVWISVVGNALIAELLIASRHFERRNHHESSRARTSLCPSS